MTHSALMRPELKLQRVESSFHSQGTAPHLTPVIIFRSHFEKWQDLMVDPGTEDNLKICFVSWLLPKSWQCF